MADLWFQCFSWFSLSHLANVLGHLIDTGLWDVPRVERWVETQSWITLRELVGRTRNASLIVRDWDKGRASEEAHTASAWWSLSLGCPLLPKWLGWVRSSLFFMNFELFSWVLHGCWGLTNVERSFCFHFLLTTVLYLLLKVLLTPCCVSSLNQSLHFCVTRFRRQLGQVDFCGLLSSPFQQWCVTDFAVVRSVPHVPAWHLLFWAYWVERPGSL